MNLSHFDQHGGLLVRYFFKYLLLVVSSIKFNKFKQSSVHISTNPEDVVVRIICEVEGDGCRFFMFFNCLFR